MAKIQQLKTISNPDEAPLWFRKFLDQLNPFLTSMNDALQGKLSLIENIQAVVGEAEILTLAATATFRPIVVKVKDFKPAVVLLAKITDSRGKAVQAGPLSYTLVDTGVRIDDLGGLAVATKYKLTILALG